MKVDLANLIVLVNPLSIGIGAPSLTRIAWKETKYSCIFFLNFIVDLFNYGVTYKNSEGKSVYEVIHGTWYQGTKTLTDDNGNQYTLEECTSP